jgi:tRNA(His) guanylyltransferase
MSKNCPIMTRMKENYESRSRTYLTRRIPVIVRLDGKAFHTYTKSLTKPFDEGLIEDMQLTATHLCNNIQGAKCVYVQSDEISILLTDYDNINTEAWFDNNVQKMVSVSASMAASSFNQLRLIREFEGDSNGDRLCGIAENIKLANFDSRVFTIPIEEVNNYFIARQRDAVKNSISMLAQSLYSHTELHGVDSNQMQELCFQKGHNWNDLHFSKKRGSLIIKQMLINGKVEYDESLTGEPIEGDLWYQPNIQSQFYPDERGRLLTYGFSEEQDDYTWMDTKIESIRSKWVVIDTPEFSKSEVITNLI